MHLKYIDKGDSLRLRKNGIYERAETRLVGRVLRPGHVFVDVGAHIGYYTVMAAELVGTQGRVYAFEPAPDTFKLLEANVEAAGLLNCRLHKYGLSDKQNTHALLALNPKNSGDHRAFNVKGRTKVAIELHRLDTILEGYAPAKRAAITVDFMKIDVQGLEHAVLQGAIDTIRSNPDIKIIVEYHALLLEVAGTSGKAMVSFLRKEGFTLCMCAKRHWIPKTDTEIIDRPFRSHFNLYCYR